jgi:hypothetical protein
MKARNLIAGAALMGALLSSNAWAWHGHHGFYGHGHSRVGVDVVIGPGYGPWWYDPLLYPSPYYYPAYSPPVIINQPPPVYIQREAAPAAPAPEENVWYYCLKAKKYYPYVRECAGGWQTVPATPPR